jgi:hypothetical protein
MSIPFIVPLSNLPTVAAQKFVEEKNVSSKTFCPNLLVPNIGLAAVTASAIKKSDAADYYREPSSIQRLFSAETITINVSKENVWAKTFGGINDDWATSIQQTSDGGYIIGGYTTSFGAGNIDTLLVKLDGNGSLSWAKTFGGTNDDWATSIQQTSDGGYIIGGSTNSYGTGKIDTLIVKLDGNGSLSWAKTFGGTNDDWATSIQQTSDGGYIIGGCTNSYGTGKIDTLVVKLDGNGSLSWAKTFGGTNDDWATSIQQTSDGGYIIGGYTTSFGAGNSDFLVIKLGNDGSLSWAKTFGGTNDDWATSIQQTSDGGYIVGGTTYSFMRGTEKDILLLKLDSNGNLPNANCNNLTVVTNLSVETINPLAKLADLNIKSVPASLNTPQIMANFQNIQLETICEGNISPFPPKDLKAILSGNSIVLSWSPPPQGTYSIGGYAIYRGTSSDIGNQVPIALVDSSTLKYIDTKIDLKSNITYFYYVKAFDDQSPPHYSDPSNEISMAITSKTIIITLQINNSMMTVNGKSYEIDPGRGTKPVIKNDRTLVPIRAIVEALGGSITWVPVNNGIAVTIKLGSVVINLQTGKSTATVNGKTVYIDPDNHKVVPEIINGRTMLPVRFVTEKLGAKVEWEQNTQTITITYQP